MDASLIIKQSNEIIWIYLNAGKVVIQCRGGKRE